MNQLSRKLSYNLIIKTYQQSIRLLCTINKDSNDNEPIKIEILEDKIKKWHMDPKTYQKWLEIGGVVKRKGHCEWPDKDNLQLINEDIAIPFPSIETTNLNGEKYHLPFNKNDCDDTNNIKHDEMKLICFSFSQYGQKIAKHWSDAGRVYGKCSVYDLNINEYGFLSFASGLFMSGLKQEVAANKYSSTLLAFGGARDFAGQLLLPNKYTGYALLVDQAGRVRFKASGEPLEGELDLLYDAINALQK